MEDILATIRAEVEAREASSLSKVKMHRNSSSKPVNSAAWTLVVNQTGTRVYLSSRGTLFNFL